MTPSGGYYMRQEPVVYSETTGEFWIRVSITVPKDVRYADVEVMFPSESK